MTPAACLMPASSGSTSDAPRSAARAVAIINDAGKPLPITSPRVTASRPFVARYQS